jgi:hypothetical protein
LSYRFHFALLHSEKSRRRTHTHQNANKNDGFLAKSFIFLATDEALRFPVSVMEAKRMEPLLTVRDAADILEHFHK